MSSTRRTSAVIGAEAMAVALASATPGEAQRQRGAGAQMRPYDVATETTVQGTVAEVKNVTGRMAAAGVAGMHIILNTNAGPLEVHLGPAWYLDEHKVALAPGDVVTVLGSRVTLDGKDAVIARRVNKGNDTWTFRDDAGRPLWAGRGRGAR